MFLLISVIFASDGSLGKAAHSHSSSPSLFASMLPIIMVILIGYIFIIRPNKKQNIRYMNMINSIKKGDKVFLRCGMFGTVAKIEDDNIVVIEIAQGVFCKFDKYTISGVTHNNVSSANCVARNEIDNKKVD